MGCNREYKNFILTVEAGIAVFKINRPEVRNALNMECYEELRAFVDEADTDEEIKVVILTGEGDKAFVAGTDIKALRERTALEGLNNLGKDALSRLENCRKPVIAAINGHAFGGGCELSLACDIRIIAAHAKVGLPETGLAILPGSGGTQRLARMIGVGRAKEMILAGRTYSAAETAEIGLTMKCVEKEALMTEAYALAKSMIAKGPLALFLAKKAINASMYTDVSTGLLIETLAFSLLLGSEDKMEGTSAFLEKREAVYKGR